ncbi:MAG: hypothetical protein N2688_04480 [Burkholderiaceae bacterium]|nr:hypothetical protein [Burkholderiaceae bacterium]
MELLERLHAALPLTGLEPRRVAMLDILPPDLRGALHDTVVLVEPPASVHDWLLDPLAATALLLYAEHRSREEVSALIKHNRRLISTFIPPERHYFPCCNFGDPLLGPMLTVRDWCIWLDAVRQADLPMQRSLAAADALIDFIVASARDAAQQPLLPVPLQVHDTDGQPRVEHTLHTLADRPARPTPPGLAERLPTELDDAPWLAPELPQATFAQWRERHGDALQALQSQLGQPVLLPVVRLDECAQQRLGLPDGAHGTEIDGLENQVDDDAVEFYAHRWVALHAHLERHPQSPCVAALLRLTGEPTPAALQARLLDPALYVEPFDLRAAALAAPDLLDVRCLIYDHTGEALPHLLAARL